MPSTRCCSPRPGASAPGSRWRSRRWPGWCGPSSRPCTATTRSSTTSWSSTASSDLGVVFVDDIAEVPDGPADHAVGPRLGARGRGRGPASGAASWSTPCARWSPRSTTRSRCGPARATASSTSATRATRRRSARWPSPPTPSTWSSRSTTSTRLPDFDQPVALLAQTTLSHRDWAGVLDAAARALPRPVDAGPQRPVLRHHQPPGGADGDRPAVRRRRRHRLGQLVEHPGPREAGPRGRLRPRCYRVNGADELPDDLAGTVGVTAGASAPEELVDAVIARLAPRRRGRGGPHHRRGRVLPAAPRAARAARPPSTSLATFALGGSVPDRPARRRPRRSPPATSSPMLG